MYCPLGKFYTGKECRYYNMASLYRESTLDFAYITSSLPGISGEEEAGLGLLADSRRDFYFIVKA